MQIPITLFRLAFIVCLLSVSVLALIPIQEITFTIGYDKGNHFIAFLVLSLLLAFCNTSYKKVDVIVYLLSYGLLLEVVQSLTTYRQFSFLDLLSDFFGIIFGLIIAKFCQTFVVVKY